MLDTLYSQVDVIDPLTKLPVHWPHLLEDCVWALPTGQELAIGTQNVCDHMLLCEQECVNCGN